VHQVDCALVETLLAKGSQCTDGSMWVLKQNVVPGVRGVACLSEGVAGKQASVLTTIGQVKAASRARHTLALKYYSKVPRLVTIGGGTTNQQLVFKTEDSIAGAPEFGKECSSDKLNIDQETKYVCAEVMIDVSAHPKGLEEFLKGQIRFFCSNQSNRWGPEREPIDYEIRLGSEGARTLSVPAIKMVG
jgi:hypothetical protein